MRRRFHSAAVRRCFHSAMVALDRVLGQSRTGAHLRNFWILAITIISLSGVNILHNTINSQVKGRRFAIGVTCAAVSAISEAGQAVLSGDGYIMSRRFERALERLGYPPRPRRRKAAHLAAQLYNLHIVEHIEHQVGARGNLLVRGNGNLDCNRLQRLAGSLVGSP